MTDSAGQSGAARIAPGVGVVKIQLPNGCVDKLVAIEAPAK